MWATSEHFVALLAKYGQRAGLPGQQVTGWAKRLRQGSLGLFNARGIVCVPITIGYYASTISSKRAINSRSAPCAALVGARPAWLLFSDGLSHGDRAAAMSWTTAYSVAPESLACSRLRSSARKDMRHARM